VGCKKNKIVANAKRGKSTWGPHTLKMMGEFLATEKMDVKGVDTNKVLCGKKCTGENQKCRNLNN